MLYAGQNAIHTNDKKAKGQFITVQGEKYYEIANYDAMQPFFISLASDTDLWMYLASTGGLTAGRRSPEQALFPYYTDDKITEQYEQTGPKTILHVTLDGKTYLWEPFSQRMEGLYAIERKIAKSTIGNKIIFCEENTTLGLRFSYLWAPAGQYGWVRRATIENLSAQELTITLVDGLQNVLPAGVERKTQNEFSTLVDGYKKTELIPHTSLVLFRMEAILVDRAEPSEALFCNTIYALGLTQANYFVSSQPLHLFCQGKAWDNTAYEEAKGVRGAIFAHTSFTLAPNASQIWYFVADVQKDATQVRDLITFSQTPQAIETIENAINQSTRTLEQIVAHNDGVQHTADEHNDARHFANTLFNTMRGGFYLNDYTIQADAFSAHIRVFNTALAQKHEAFLNALPAALQYHQLIHAVREQKDPQLLRLAYEYLPITFGRRHGDPSRPWNMFDIQVKDAKGQPIVSYQGNWRDIFQNWEALSLSYPNFINSIIAKFLNATTVDGYNPYRITNQGIDWEVIEPENPWSNIGYWGDHQIIYLLKLLELSHHYAPQQLATLLNERIFAFANVPYRLKSFAQIVEDPKNSILFDDPTHQHVMNLTATYGQDAKLVLDKDNQVLLTTMADKLLITLLAKLSNFVPQAGIWMNTLRPEWNDANNALVGYGASMVTLCYMRRYIAFLQQVIQTDIQVAKETCQMLHAVQTALCEANSTPTLTPHAICQITTALGQAGEQYRTAAYAGLSGEQTTITIDQLRMFFTTALQAIDSTIRANKRQNGLYEAYNLIQFDCETIQITHLYEMLEGQVAVLSSGLLTAIEAVELLDAMRQSDLYREDQRSYMLYPNRRRLSFLELNNIPSSAKQLPVIQQCILDNKQDIICVDAQGGLHFNAAFKNADYLDAALKKHTLSDEDRNTMLNLYESVFNHHAFTGRSGTFYKYEGLGSIYWHMVSKLLLAVGEIIQSSEAVPERLKTHYLAIREGIGSHKQPAEYGSFPFDPYSHTPSMAGVQQPGMTGQVKEDIISRFMELGVTVREGVLTFRPQILTADDFDTEKQLSFSYCGVPITYVLQPQSTLTATVITTDGEQTYTGDQYACALPAEITHAICARNGQVTAIIITLPTTSTHAAIRD
ncbi:MAG: hypothetical protein U0L62_04905 [Paludibacteraceae bacterium]|nr:hypothetical protein [Paludibacteraceae bacterium]